MTTAVTVTFAQSLDGRLAASGGHSRWISCPETLRLAHQLRSQHQAVVVGIGTVLNDDPQLTCRLVAGTSPVRVILDSHLRIPLSSVVVQTAPRVPTLIATTSNSSPSRREALEAAGARVLVLEADVAGRVLLGALLAGLAADGLTNVLVEGGPRVISSCLALVALARLVVVTAPILLGGDAPGLLTVGVTEVAAAFRPRHVHTSRLGTDLVWDLQR